MRRVLLAIITSGVALIGYSCHGKSPTTPAMDSGPPDSTLKITNFEAHEVGTVHDVCPSFASFYAIDQLNFQISTTNSNGIVGATVTSYEAGQPASLGPIQQCAFGTQNRCPGIGPPTICYEAGNNGGGVQIFHQTAWTPVRVWSLSLATQDRTSNTASATINRPDNWPSGDQAMVVFLEAKRVGAASATFQYVVYSPGVVGRKIDITQELFSGGARLSTAVTPFNEQAGAHSISGVGGLVIAAGATDLVMTLAEKDTAGTVLFTNAKQFTINP